MEVNNPLYRNQGIHVIATVFTIEKGITKVLLVKRTNEPFYGMWGLVGGALYNNETLIEGMKRELREKVGITNINLEMFDTFDKVDRSPVMRMIGIGYIGVIDANKVSILKTTMKTSDSDWVAITNIPKLAYDYNEILERAIETLKVKILKTDILKALYPEGFTLPELRKVYEAVLNKSIDRRNFRTKMINLGLIKDTGKIVKFEGKKPAKLYAFKEKSTDKNVF